MSESEKNGNKKGHDVVGVMECVRRKEFWGGNTKETTNALLWGSASHHSSCLFVSHPTTNLLSCVFKYAFAFCCPDGGF